MTILRPARILRAHLRASPDRLFVFGDNLSRRGYGGQAKEMRGEPNSIRLPTKRSPYDYLQDSDLQVIKQATLTDRLKLIDHLTFGGIVVWPAAGIGTGLARLRSNAPLVANFYDLFLIQLEDL